MKKNKFLIKSLAIVIFMVTVSNAGTYDNYYSVGNDNKNVLSKNDNRFIDGDFQEIIHFNPLQFRYNNLNEKSRENYKFLVEKIRNYQDRALDFKVVVIGYTNESTDNKNEQSIDSKTYANKIQNMFRYKESIQSVQNRTQSYVANVQEKLLSDGINKNNIVIEFRGGQDLMYTDESANSRDLSNRVMLTLYVFTSNDTDSDKDGVFDVYDKCQETPEGFSVDIYGCPIDTDLDGVVDYQDRCEDTPKGINVDIKGCPIDTDEDGIADYKDSCIHTPTGISVDPLGCPLKQTK